MKDVLFLLPPGFVGAGGRREYCPECAEMWGVLSYYPALKEAVEIRYVDIAHPRSPITSMLGEGRFNAPTLVLADPASVPQGLTPKIAQGRSYFDSARAIALYFAALYGIAVPRGS